MPPSFSTVFALMNILRRFPLSTQELFSMIINQLIGYFRLGMKLADNLKKNTALDYFSTSQEEEDMIFNLGTGNCMFFSIGG
jgi:hypothetical protein